MSAFKRIILSLCFAGLACSQSKTPTLSLVLISPQETPQHLTTRDGETLSLSSEVIATQRDVASASLDASGGTEVLSLQLQGDAAKRLEESTSAHLGERLAIIVDGNVVSTPVIKSPISGGHLQISVSSAPEAKTLTALNAQ